MLNIQNQIFLDIEVDGAPLPSSANLIRNVILPEGGGWAFPQARLELTDVSGNLVKDRALVEGNSIIVTVGRSPNDPNVTKRQYRLFGQPQRSSASGSNINIVCIYDAPQYLMENVSESYRGTSAEVIAAVAAKCKLSYSGPELNRGSTPADSQVWLNMIHSRMAFVRDVARHGYINDLSCMDAVLTSRGVLVYRNWADVIETPVDQIRHVFLHNVPDGDTAKGKVVYHVRDSKYNSSAGLMNAWTNYGSTRNSHSLSGRPDIHKSIDVKSRGGYFAINDQVSKTLTRARTDFSPLDCGNEHPKYERALYQNLRHLALFSERMSVLVYEVTEVELYDPVIYRQADADPNQPMKNSDVYIVIGKTIMVKDGSNYCERFELARLTVPEKGRGALKACTGDDMPAADRVIPNPIIDRTNTVVRDVLPAVSAISRGLMGTSTAMAALNNIFPMANRSVLAAVPSLAGLAQMLTDGASSSDLLRGLNMALPSLENMNQVYGTADNRMLDIEGQYQDVANQCMALSPAMRNQSLMLPNGVLEQTVYGMSNVTTMRNMSSILSSVNAALQGNVDLRSLQSAQYALEDMQIATDRMNGRSVDYTTTYGRCWNNSVQVMTGSRPVYNPVYQPRNTSVFTQMLSMLGPVLGPNVRTVVQLMQGRNDDRSYRWIDPSYLGQQQIPQCRAAERLNILSTTKSRTTSMVQQAQTYRA